MHDDVEGVDQDDDTDVIMKEVLKIVLLITMMIMVMVVIFSWY